MIEVFNITKTFTTGLWRRNCKLAVDKASFSVQAGKTLGLIGMSGSGKSTLGRIALKLIPCDTGRIIFDGEDISDFTMRQMKKLRTEMQILFQNPETSLNPRFTIAESMLEPYSLHGRYRQKNIEEQIERWFQFAGLSMDLLTRWPHQLSGGQLQRLCIVRALLLRPKFLVLDEPTSMLDVSVQAQIIALLREAQKKERIAYLFISHDLDLIKACSDEIAIMYQGRIIEQQSTEDLYRHPREEYTKELLDAFLNF